MMVMALSATPHITSCTVVPVSLSDTMLLEKQDVGRHLLGSSAPRLWILGTLMRDAAPALQASVSPDRRFEATGVGEPHKTPMLMANNTPIFSCLFIIIPQIIFQGNNARVMSITPEYAVYRAHTD